MKKALLFALLFLSASIYQELQSQDTRYFQFSTFCGGNDWRDTSFVAALTDPELINTVISEIERPFEQRKFIIGDIAQGDGGFNFNGEHRFNWHFVTDKWQLAEVAIEVCDGCPFSNVEQDTAYWVGNLGFFCPWTSKPAREIFLTSVDEVETRGNIKVYPNPASQSVFIQHTIPGKVTIELRSVTQANLRFIPTVIDGRIDVADYPPGLYILQFRGEKSFYTKKLVIQAR